MTHRTFSRGTHAALIAVLTALLTGCLERELKPLNPCLVSGVVAEVEVSNIDKVDLLFMVDNSQSMEGEQKSLSREFPKLIKALASGDRNGDGIKDFTPVKDLHLGVVSSDLGLANLTLPATSDSCTGTGDDGRLMNTAASSVTGCSQSTYNPPYLTYDVAKGGDPTQLAADFSCIATLGTKGCGFEQQLESALKAVWPGNDPSRVFLTDAVTRATGPGNGGPGFANGEFIREDSLIAIVIVTDEEDCSSKSMNHFVENTGTGLNTRCFHEGQKPGDNGLFGVQRYIESFKALRPGRENLVIFAGIVGVPERLVTAEAMGAYDFKDKTQADAFFDGLLNDPEMQERIDDNGTPTVIDDDNLVPSCNRGEDARAFPPRRIVEVAKGFGANGVIQSICQDNFGPAMDAIIKTIAEQLPDVCLPRPLVRASDGLVECNVIWELPREPMGTTPTRCDERGFLAPPDSNRSDRGENGGAACKVTQLPVVGTTEPSGTDGWYYDDFSADTLEQCTLYPDKQRITFTPGATLPSGVLVKLECLNETQSLPNTRTDLQQDIEQPAVGDGCDMVMLRGREVSNDEACVVLLAEPVNGSNEDRSLFCHLESRVCVQRCSTSAECPAAWVCDTDPDRIAKAGHAYCVNPTCGSGGD